MHMHELHQQSVHTNFVTCLFQFKDVLNEELLKVLISIVDAKLFKTYHKQKVSIIMCIFMFNKTKEGEK